MVGIIVFVGNVLNQITFLAIAGAKERKIQPVTMAVKPDAMRETAPGHMSLLR
jgi:hypothetical protein